MPYDATQSETGRLIRQAQGMLSHLAPVDDIVLSFVFLFGEFSRSVGGYMYVQYSCCLELRLIMSMANHKIPCFEFTHGGVSGGFLSDVLLLCRSRLFVKA